VVDLHSSYTNSASRASAHNSPPIIDRGRRVIDRWRRRRVIDRWRRRRVIDRWRAYIDRPRVRPHCPRWPQYRTPPDRHPQRLRFPLALELAEPMRPSLLHRRWRQESSCTLHCIPEAAPTEEQNYPQCVTKRSRDAKSDANFQRLVETSFQKTSPDGPARSPKSRQRGNVEAAYFRILTEINSSETGRPRPPSAYREEIPEGE